VTHRTTPFDRFAEIATAFVSRGVFFTLCVLLVLIWAPPFVFFDSLETWQLLINSATTIVTFLLVALLQNSQVRADMAIQEKLNALASALGELMAVIGKDHPELLDEREELHAVVGIEREEGTGT
jgi:low affinity Fe/Cu permease